MRSRGWSFWLRGFFLILLAVAAGLAEAQPPGLAVDATVGFDGYYRPGSWVPVFVNVDNRPQNGASLDTVNDFKGQLMLESSPTDTSGRPLRFLRDIDVPRSSSKRYVVYAKFPDTGGTGPIAPNLLVNQENGRREMELRLNAVPADANRLIMVFVFDQIGLPSFPKLGDQLNTFLETKLDPANLPEHWAAYDSADVLVFPGWPGSGVRQEQLDAIMDWVQMGGTLVFLGGANAQTYVDDVAKSALPVEIEGTARLWELDGGLYKLQREGEPGPADDKRPSFVFTMTHPRPGAEVLAYQEEAPLAVRQTHGLGQILFISTDLQSSTLGLERRLADVWFSVAPVPDYAEARYELPDALRNLKTLTGRAARAPNQFIIILICIVYTIIVGPVNFAILGRRKKLEWAWFTVPTIVLFFFFLVYGLGRLTKSGQNIFREIAVQEFADGGKEGRTTTYAGAFAARPGRYFVRPAKEFHSFEDPYSWFQAESFRGRDYVQAATTALAARAATGDAPVISFEPAASDIYIRSWEMGIYDAATFVNRGPEELNGTIESDLRWAGRSPSGQITNRTGEDFSDSWLVVGDDMLPIGALKNGESFDIPANSPRPLRWNVSEAGRLTRNPASSYRDAVPVFDDFQMARPSTDQDVNANNFGVIMSALWRPKDTGVFFPAEAGNVYFLGYREGPELEDSFTNTNPEVKSRAVATLVRLNTAPDVGQTFAVPFPYLRQRLLFYSSKIGHFEVTGGGQLEMSRSVGIFSYELPFYDPNLEVTSIGFDPQFRLGQERDEDLIFQIYRYSPIMGQRGWVTIEPGSVFTNEGYAVPGSGRVFIRVESRPKDEENQRSFTAFNAYNVIGQIGVSLTGRVTN